MKKCLFILLAGILMFSGLSIAQTNPKWITQVIMSPPNPSVGTVVQFSATFRIAKGPSTNLRVVGGVDGKPIYNQKFPSLPKSADQPVMFNWTAVAGPHTAFFELIPDPSSGDEVPGDNFLEKAFNVSGGGPGPLPVPGQVINVGPNLVIEKVSWNPAQFTWGGTIKFSFFVKNIGIGVVNPVPLITFSTNGQAPLSLNMPAPPASGLKQGESLIYKAETKSNCIGNKSTVKIVIDPANQLKETNENDNTWTHEFSCIIETAPLLLKPNLTITSFSTQKLSGNICSYHFKHGEANICAVFNFAIKNTGLVDIKSSSYYAIRSVSGPGMQIPPLKAGQEWKESITGLIECNRHYKLMIDSTYLIDESDETDNMSSPSSYLCYKTFN